VTTETPHVRPAAGDIVDIHYHRAEALMLRDRHSFDLMRGAGVTTWALVAGAVLLLAVVAFAPRDTATTEVASGNGHVTISAKVR
jgi:polysaccharide pyruvyl transferase WcaK-like protein